MIPDKRADNLYESMRGLRDHVRELQPAREAEAAGFERVLQRREEDPAEVAREDPDGQEEPGAAGDTC